MVSATGSLGSAFKTPTVETLGVFNNYEVGVVVHAFIQAPARSTE